MSSWTAENKFRLLLAIISTQKISGHKWDDVAEMMGRDFNWNACRQQYNKLRKEAGATLHMMPNEYQNETTPTKSSPQKEKSSKNENAKTQTPERRKRKKAVPDANGVVGNSNDDAETPHKKIKQE